MFNMPLKITVENITVEDNKNRMNIVDFMNIYRYIYIYIPISYVKRMTQNKNDSTNSILQHGRGSIF